MRPLTALAALVALSAFTVACGGEDADEPAVQEQTLQVGHYRVPCQGEARQLCYRVRDPLTGEWLLEYDGIQGLEYQWGTRYTVAVVREPVPAPPADGSGVRTYLDHVEESAVDRSEFVLDLEPADLVASTGWGDFILLSEKAVACASDELCNVLRARMASGMGFRVAMRADEDPTLPLIAFRVVQ